MTETLISNLVDVHWLRPGDSRGATTALTQKYVFGPQSEHRSLRLFYALSRLAWKQMSRQAERNAEIQQIILLSILDSRIKDKVTAGLS